MPEFLDLFHSYADEFCKELDKAEIARVCPEAKRDYDNLLQVFTFDYALTLSEEDQARLLHQMAVGDTYLPDRPEICSPVWIEEHLPPIAEDESVVR